MSTRTDRAGSARETKADRKARLEQLQAEQRRAAKKRERTILVVAVAVAVALVVPAAVLIGGELREQSALDAAARGDIEGVVEYADLSANHVRTPVEYDPVPPVGGDHDATWQNCGFYDAPVVQEHAVHSLEHGAVWVTYRPDLAAGDVDRLRELTDDHPYLLVSPLEDLDSPLVASAWGVQLALDSTDDERLEVFLRKYLQGPQTLEPGAACSGGIGA